MLDDFNEHQGYLTDQKIEEILRQGEEERLAIRNRWKTNEMKTALVKVVSALQLGQPWTDFLSDLPNIEEVFTGWDLRGASIGSVNLSGADFKDVALYFIDLQGANLAYADFRGADLVYADLSRSNLSGANFEGCIMGRINLQKANLSNAQLAGASLVGGNLVEANFSGADLTDANLFGAKLEGAVFDKAILKNTRFGELAK